MGDPDIQLVLEAIDAKVKSDHRHYALVPKFEHASLREASKYTYNIDFIEYQQGQHQQFPVAVSELIALVRSLRAANGMQE